MDEIMARRRRYRGAAATMRPTMPDLAGMVDDDEDEGAPVVGGREKQERRPKRKKPA